MGTSSCRSRRRSRALARIVVAAIAATAVAALPLPSGAATHAAPRGVDPDFGRRGRVERVVNGALGAEVIAAARAPGGDLVIALEPAHTKWGCCSADVGSWAIARLTPDGARRTTFGSGGIVQPVLRAQPGSVGSFAPTDMVVDTSGRPLLLGRLPDRSGDRSTSALLRVDARGRVDRSFGDAGVLRLPRPGGCPADPVASDLLPTPSGRLFAFGSCSASGGFRLVIWRLTSSGVPDRAFGTQGSRLIALPPAIGACCSPRAVLHPSGAIDVGTGSNVAAVVRLTSAGSPDPTFSGDGIAPVPTMGFASQGASTVVPAPDGGAWFDLDGRLARLGPNGARDASFATRTFDRPATCSYPRLIDVLRLGTGLIGAVHCTEGLTLARMDTSGVADTSFGVIASDTRPTSGASFSQPRRMLHPDGTGFLVVGSAGSGLGVVVERRLANGQLDPTYGSSGRTRLTITGRVFDLTEADGSIDRLGRTVIVARVDNRSLGDENAFAVLRLRRDGRVDTTFGSRGTRFVEAGGFRPGDHEESGPPHVTHHPDNSITLVAGWANQASALGDDEQGLVHVRLSSTGAVMPNSRRVVVLPGQTGPGISSVVPGPDGTTLVAYNTYDGERSRTAVVRLTRTGLVDPTFASAGAVSLTPDAAYSDERLVVAPATNGAVVVAWRNYSNDFDRDAFIIARLLPDGSRDAAFGRQGVFRRNLPDDVAMTTTRSGEIVLAWTDVRASDGVFMTHVMRLDARGRPDSAFGRRGVAAFPVERVGRPLAVVAHGDRPDLLTEHIDSTRDVWRLTSRGTIDTRFGDRGRVVVDRNILSVGGLRHELVAGPGATTTIVTVPYTGRSEAPASVVVTRVR